MQFREEFDTLYGELGPEWQGFSWEDSSRQAHTQFKFLLVYLHSPNHQVGGLCLQTHAELFFDKDVDRAYPTSTGHVDVATDWPENCSCQMD